MSETTLSAPAEGAQPGGTPTADARAWLPEAYRNDPAFASFKSVDSLAKSFKDTQAFVGADKATLLRVPKDDAPEAWADVWTKLGRPQKPEGYTFEGLDDFPDEVLAGFRAAAFEAGLPAKQAQAIAGWYVKREAEQREAMRVNTEAELRKEWGSAYEDRLHGARQVLQTLGDEGLRDWVEKSGFGNHPSVLRMFAAVWQKLAEPGALKGGSGTQPGVASMTPAEAKAEVARLHEDREFMNRYYAGNVEARARMRQLFDMIAPPDRAA